MWIKSYMSFYIVIGATIEDTELVSLVHLIRICGFYQIERRFVLYKKNKKKNMVDI